MKKHKQIKEMMGYKLDTLFYDKFNYQIRYHTNSYLHGQIYTQIHNLLYGQLYEHLWLKIRNLRHLP